MAHTLNPSTWEAEAGGFEFEVSLVYRVSSRTARATQRNPVSKKQTNKRKPKRQVYFLHLLALTCRYICWNPLLQDSSFYRSPAETTSSWDWKTTGFLDFLFTAAHCWVSWTTDFPSLMLPVPWTNFSPTLPTLGGWRWGGAESRIRETGEKHWSMFSEHCCKLL